MIQIKSLHIYPVKSMRGISLPQIKIEASGPQLDRNWMLVNAENTFISQRQFPSLVRFQPALSARGIIIRYQQHEIEIPFEGSLCNKLEKVQIWKDEQKAREVSKLHNEFFSHILNTPVRLMRCDFSELRKTPAAGKKAARPPGFADSQPVLITSKASLSLLENIAGQKIEMNRFRPNMVVTGHTPFEEDNWQALTFPNGKMKIVKPCGRCIIPSIDQRTGEKGKEPLASLHRFRKKGNKVLFGIYAELGQNQPVTVSTGEKIEVLKCKNPVSP